jgi:hypothetical protein
MTGAELIEQLGMEGRVMFDGAFLPPSTVLSVFLKDCSTITIRLNSHDHSLNASSDSSPLLARNQHSAPSSSIFRIISTVLGCLYLSFIVAGMLLAWIFEMFHTDTTYPSILMVQSGQLITNVSALVWFCIYVMRLPKVVSAKTKGMVFIGFVIILVFSACLCGLVAIAAQGVQMCIPQNSNYGPIYEKFLAAAILFGLACFLGISWLVLFLWSTKVGSFEPKKQRTNVFFYSQLVGSCCLLAALALAIAIVATDYAGLLVHSLDLHCGHLDNGLILTAADIIFIVQCFVVWTPFMFIAADEDARLFVRNSTALCLLVMFVGQALFLGGLCEGVFPGYIYAFPSVLMASCLCGFFSLRGNKSLAPEYGTEIVKD